MKKIMLSTIAAGAVFAAAPAMAQVDLKIGGYTKNYLGWLNQDDDPTAATGDANNFDMLRDSEWHMNAEATADNGLTYGFHTELNTNAGNTTNVPDESYMYLSSNLGRVNLGSEDGANYLLQVAAPSADSNIDGIRQYIQPVNYAEITATGAFDTYLQSVANATTGGDGWDYDNDFTGVNEKITYLSPIWNGFQFGVSYTPDLSGTDLNSFSGVSGFAVEGLDNATEDAYEGAVRYEGNFNNIGFAVGAGYTHANVTETTVPAALDDYKEWNVGLDMDIGAFGVGAAYTRNNNSAQAQDTDRTWVVGADYTTGPFQFGASYYDREDDDTVGGTGSYDTTRLTGGVIYTAAPGLSFRGSISKIKHESPTAGVGDADATSVMGGVQMNF